MASRLSTFKQRKQRVGIIFFPSWEQLLWSAQHCLSHALAVSMLLDDPRAASIRLVLAICAARSLTPLSSDSDSAVESIK